MWSMRYVIVICINPQKVGFGHEIMVMRRCPSLHALSWQLNIWQRTFLHEGYITLHLIHVRARNDNSVRKMIETMSKAVR